MELRVFWRCTWLSLILASSGALTSAQTSGPRIGILGDVHGRKEELKQVLEAFRQAGVTHIIEMGDLNSGYFSLEDGLKALSQQTGVTPEQIYLVPGNWEYLIMSPAQVTTTLQKHGHLVVDRDDAPGFVEIGGRRIMVSHYPVRPIPPEYQPPGGQKEEKLIDSTASKAPVSMDTDLIIDAHTHVRALYADRGTGVTRLNVGTLDMEKAGPNEKPSYAIYDTRSGRLSVYELGVQESVQSVVAVRRFAILGACFEREFFNPPN